MAAKLYAGTKSLNLVLDTPYDTIRVDDIRDDLTSVKVWYSTTQGFDPNLGQGTLAFDGSGLSITIPNLATNTKYYVRYAFISIIDPTTYTISAELSETTFAEVQALAGRVVSLEADRSVFTYDIAGANPSPSGNTITATTYNTTGKVYYEFFLEGVMVQNSDVNKYVYTAKASYADMPDKVSVKIREGSTTSTVLAEDFIEFVPIKAGASAINFYISNPAQSIYTTAAGVSTYTGSGTSITVYEGTTQLSEDSTSPYAPGTFRVTAEGTSILPSSPSGTGTSTLVYGNHSDMTDNQARIKYTIIVKNSLGVETTYVTYQNFSKSIQGAKGDTGDSGKSTFVATVYKQVKDDPTPPAATNSTYNFSNGVLTPPTGWLTIQPTTTTTNTWACEYTFIGAPTETVTGVGNWSATRIDAVAGAPGANGVSINTVELYQQADSPPGLPTGTSYDFSTDTVTGTLGSWVRTMPDSSILPTYMTSCTFTVTAPTTTQTRAVWSTAVVVAQKGAIGSIINPTVTYDFGGSTLPTNITATGSTLASSDNGTTTTITTAGVLGADQNVTISSLSLLPVNNYLITMRVKLVSGTWEGKIYYSNTATSPVVTHGSDELYYKAIPAPQTGVWTEITVDMRELTAGSTNYSSSNTITNLRFDFVNTVGAVVVIDYISIGKFGVATPIYPSLTSPTDTVSSLSTGLGYTLPTGNSLSLYSGSTKLTSGVTYAVTAPATVNGLSLAINSTTGAITLSGAAWTSTAEKFTLTATYNSIVYTTTYSITKTPAGTNGIDGKLVTITVEKQAFAYNAAGTTPNPSSTIITPIAQNITSPVYEFLVNGTTVQNDSLTATYNYNAAAAYASMPQQVTVKVRSGATTGTVLATDTMTMIGVKVGVNSITGFLTNEAATVAADNAGTVAAANFNTAGGTFNVYDGVTDKTGSSVVYSVVAGSAAGVSIAIDATTGVYAISAMSAPTGTATLRAVYSGVTIDKVYSISKSIAGALGLTGPGGPAVDLTTTAQAFAYNAAGTTPSPTTTTVTATAQNITNPRYEFLVNGVTKQISTVSDVTSSNTYSYTPAAAYTSMPEQLTVKVRSTTDTSAVLATDTMAMIGVKVGVNSITGFLSNEAATVAADSTGAVTAFTGTGGTFNVYDGVTDKTGNAAVTYSVVAGSTVGLSIAITAAGVYSISALSADIGTATLRAVYSGVTIDKVYSVSKSKAGGNAVTANISNKTPILATDVNGTVTTYATSGTVIRVYDGITELTYDAVGTGNGTWKITVSATNITASTLPGATANVKPATIAAHSAMTADNALITYTITGKSVVGTAFTLTETQSFTKAKAGAKTITAKAYQWSTSATVPTLPTTTLTYTWATSAFSGTFDNGWSFTVGTPTNGQKLYEISKIITETVVTATTTTFTFASASSNIISIRQDGSIGYTGPRVIDIYYYYSSTSSTAPTAPGASEVTYNFSTATASTINANWSSQFSPANPTSADGAANKFWAVRVTFRESVDSAGVITQVTPVVSAPFTWQNFDGLVTFTNLAEGKDVDGVATTIINGAGIKTGTIAADRINTTTLSAIQANLGFATVASTGGYIKTANRAYGGASEVAVVGPPAIPIGTPTAGFFLGYDGTAYKFDIGNAAKTKYLSYDGTTLSMIGGTINIGTTGSIYGGQTGYNTGPDGFFLGYSTDDYKFSVGFPGNVVAASIVNNNFTSPTTIDYTTFLGTEIYFSDIGTLTNISINTKYYVAFEIGANTFKISKTFGGSVITLTGTPCNVTYASNNMLWDGSVLKTTGALLNTPVLDVPKIYKANFTYKTSSLANKDYIKIADSDTYSLFNITRRVGDNYTAFIYDDTGTGASTPSMLLSGNRGPSGYLRKEKVDYVFSTNVSLTSFPYYYEVGTRILLKGQSDSATNGIYYIVSQRTNLNYPVLARTPDANTWASFRASNGARMWLPGFVVATSVPIVGTLGSTPITFVDYTYSTTDTTYSDLMNLSSVGGYALYAIGTETTNSGVALIEGSRVTGQLLVTASSTGTLTTQHAGRFYSKNAAGTTVSSAIVGGANGFAFYSELGGYGPFTGYHDCLINKTETIEVGDILIDVKLIARKDISNTIFECKKSNIKNAKPIGVYLYREAMDATDPPAAFIDDIVFETIKRDEFSPKADLTIKRIVPKPELAAAIDLYDLGSMNAVGEGQVNVCGENGDLEAGDLIVTSSIPGKGMKQDDGIIRNITVAKCREAVTFSSPSEIKLVSCIYLCG